MTSPAAWRLVLAYVLAYFVLLYWAYPFDGMVVNESWNFHVNEVQQFKFPGYGDSTKTGSPKTFLYDPETGRYDLSFVHSRRGLVPIIYLLFEALSVGNHVVFMNVLCVTVLAANLLLFAYVVWRLAGPSLLLPSVVVYSLYPFAAASHFLQVIVVNNLAVTLFLLSLSLFLEAIASAGSVRRLAAWGLPAMLCYWLSIFNHEYALFLSPLCLYVALYERHGGATLWRFTEWRAPAVLLGAAFLAISAAAGAFLVADVPSVLLYAPRFRELALALHAPEGLVPLLMAGLNALLFYLSAAFSNSLGYLFYPLLLLWHNLGALPAWQIAVAAGGLLSAALVWVLVATARPASPRPDERRKPGGFLLLFGTAWAALAYLPFSTSIGYPRIVGMMADRVNILAACGISLVLGWLLHRLLMASPRISAPARGVVLAGLWLLLGVLALNLAVQRSYYVDAYRKEREIARVVLEAGEEARRVGRQLIVLLDKPTKATFPRAQLMAALQAPGFAAKARQVGGFLFDRYFKEEVISTSFHLQGLYLFGCCPDSGHQTFEGYAKLWAKPAVPVFKVEEPFRLYEDDEAWRIGYQDIQVWSYSFGEDKVMTFPKRDTDVVVVELDEAFFRFRGSVAYRLRPYGGGMAGADGPPRLLSRGDAPSI